MRIQKEFSKLGKSKNFGIASGIIIENWYTFRKNFHFFEKNYEKKSQIP